MAKAQTKAATTAKSTEKKIAGTSVPASFATGEVPATGTEPDTSDVAKEAVATAANANTETKGTVTHNPKIPTDAEMIASAKANQKQRDDDIKAEKAKAKANKKAIDDAAKADKAKARADGKAERQARLDALAAEGKKGGSMLALADAVKQGKYVVGATGQLRSTDELAIALDGVSPTDVVRVGLDMLKLEDNPYTKLNIGQQSMNLRNRMRGAIKKGDISIEAIKNYIVRNNITVTPVVDPEVKAAAKAEKQRLREEAKATAEANRNAKAAVKSAEAGTADQVDLTGKTEQVFDPTT